MSNSALATYIRLSPNKTSPRNHKIDTITIHCAVCQCTAKQILDMSHFVTYSPDKGSSCNYAIGFDGSIGIGVNEKDRSWCSSNPANDRRAITIEVASDTKHPYAITDAAYQSLIKLCADICKRNDIKELKWQGDKSLIGQIDKQNMTVHRWFANKACPGDYIYERLGRIASDVNREINKSEESADMVYNKIDEVPDFARATIQKLCDKGSLKGDGSGLKLTYDMLRILVILDRTGVFD